MISWISPHIFSLFCRQCRCDVTVFTLACKAEVMNGTTAAHWMIYTVKSNFILTSPCLIIKVLSLHVGVV